MESTIAQNTGINPNTGLPYVPENPAPLQREVDTAMQTKAKQYNKYADAWNQDGLRGVWNHTYTSPMLQLKPVTGDWNKGYDLRAIAGNIFSVIIVAVMIILFALGITYLVKGFTKKQWFAGGPSPYVDIPLSTLPDGRQISGSGDALLGSSAGFVQGPYYEEINFPGQVEVPEKCQTKDPELSKDYMTAKLADAQLVYSTFTDQPSHETMYEGFADAIITNTVNPLPGVAKAGVVPSVVIQDKNAELPYGLGTCAESAIEPLKKTSDEYLMRTWGARLF